jgi:enoyl-ACP reductase-like protein
MSRLGRPEEVAAVAVNFASDESAFTTGQIHGVDGGSTDERPFQKSGRAVWSRFKIRDALQTGDFR